MTLLPRLLRNGGEHVHGATLILDHRGCLGDLLIGLPATLGDRPKVGRRRVQRGPAFRALAAVGASAGMVIPRAMVRDLAEGHAAAVLADL